LRREAPGTSVAANERDSMSSLARRVRDLAERGINAQSLSVAPSLAHPKPEVAPAGCTIRRRKA
jgi:hypothetical protein